MQLIEAGKQILIRLCRAPGGLTVFLDRLRVYLPVIPFSRPGVQAQDGEEIRNGSGGGSGGAGDGIQQRNNARDSRRDGRRQAALEGLQGGGSAVNGPGKAAACGLAVLIQALQSLAQAARYAREYPAKRPVLEHAPHAPPQAAPCVRRPSRRSCQAFRCGPGALRFFSVAFQRFRRAG